MSKSHYRWRLAATALVLTLAFVAFGTAAPVSGGDTLPPFKFGIITGINTALNNIPEFVAGAQAAAAAVNKQGGIGGRQVQIIPCSHQSLAAIEIQCAQMMVDQNVDDVFQYGSLAQQGAPILQAAGIPEITAATQQPADFRNSTFFPLGAGTLECYTAAVEYALNAGQKTFAGLGQISAATSQNLALTATAVQRYGRGAKWLGTVFYPPSAGTDIISYAQQLKNLGAQVVISQTSEAPQAAFMSDNSQLGYAPQVVHVGLIVGASDMTGYPDKGATMLLGLSFPPNTATQYPAVRMWLAQLQAAGLANDPVNLKQESMHGWAAVWALQKLAQRIKGPVTKESMLAAVKKVTSKNPINIFGLFNWDPGTPGPVAYKQDPGYPCWIGKGDSAGNVVLASKSTYNTFQALGLVKASK